MILSRSPNGGMHASPFRTHSTEGSTVGYARVQMLSAGEGALSAAAYRFAERYLFLLTYVTGWIPGLDALSELFVAVSPVRRPAANNAGQYGTRTDTAVEGRQGPTNYLRRWPGNSQRSWMVTVMLWDAPWPRTLPSPHHLALIGSRESSNLLHVYNGESAERL